LLNTLGMVLPYILLIVALAGNVVEAIKRGKNIYFFLFLLIFCWLMSWMTVGGPDFEAYYLHYQNMRTPSGQSMTYYDIGYSVLVVLFSRILNVSFNGFRAVIYFIGFALIGKTIWKHSKTPNTILLVYAITLLAVDIVQIRNFLASVVIISSLGLVLDRKLLRLAMMILLAALLHKVCLVYLVIPLSLFFYREIDEKYFMPILIAVITVFLLIYLSKPLIALSVDVLKDYIKIFRELSYLEGGLTTRRSYWVYWCYQTLLIYLGMKYHSSGKNTLSIGQYNAQSLLLNVNLWFLVFVPLFLFNTNFLRIYRNMFLINTIFIYDGYTSSENRTIIDFFLLLIFWAVSFYGFSAYSNSISPLFLESLLFRIRF
jgi:hypothetical protein